MANNNSSHYLMPTFDSEEAFNAYFRKDTGWFVVSGEGEVLMGAKK